MQKFDPFSKGGLFNLPAFLGSPQKEGGPSGGEGTLRDIVSADPNVQLLQPECVVLRQSGRPARQSVAAKQNFRMGTVADMLDRLTQFHERIILLHRMIILCTRTPL